MVGQVRFVRGCFIDDYLIPAWAVFVVRRGIGSTFQKLRFSSNLARLLQLLASVLSGSWFIWTHQLEHFYLLTSTSWPGQVIMDRWLRQLRPSGLTCWGCGWRCALTAAVMNAVSDMRLRLGAGWPTPATITPESWPSTWPRAGTARRKSCLVPRATTSPVSLWRHGLSGAVYSWRSDQV